MPHETRFKFKVGSDWVYQEDLEAHRETRNAAVAEKKGPAPIVLNTLPPKEELDPEFPIEQLFFEHPEVRGYITEDGKIRLGIPPEAVCKAEAILAKYK